MVGVSVDARQGADHRDGRRGVLRGQGPPDGHSCPSGTRVGSGQRTVYAPPEGADVIRDKLSDWERFIHADNDLDPVIRMAAAHYQFEAIHPFCDGNGRTGRILNILTLVSTGVLWEPILYLSRPIIDSKSDYYPLLLAVTADRGRVGGLVALPDRCRSKRREHNYATISAARARDTFAADHRSATPGMDNAAFQQLLFAQPYIRIGRVVEACSVSRQTASAWLHASPLPVPWNRCGGDAM